MSNGAPSALSPVAVEIQSYIARVRMGAALAVAGPENCASWDYEAHPDVSWLSARCAALKTLLLRSTKRFDRYRFDTRRGHRFMFRGLAPQACPCLAGNYRGSQVCAELANYTVQVGNDSKPGIWPQLVAWQMLRFDAACSRLCVAFESARASGRLSQEQLTLDFVRLLCDVMEQFFLIHPYANGNGHAGRLLVCTLMTRYGYRPVHWPIDDRPPYDQALPEYRAGNPKPLMLLMLRAARGEHPVP